MSKKMQKAVLTLFPTPWQASMLEARAREVIEHGGKRLRLNLRRINSNSVETLDLGAIRIDTTNDLPKVKHIVDAWIYVPVKRDWRLYVLSTVREDLWLNVVLLPSRTQEKVLKIREGINLRRGSEWIVFDPKSVVLHKDRIDFADRLLGSVRRMSDINDPKNIDNLEILDARISIPASELWFIRLKCRRMLHL
jgi:hypothetical protein